MSLGCEVCKSASCASSSRVRCPKESSDVLCGRAEKLLGTHCIRDHCSHTTVPPILFRDDSGMG